MKTRLSDTEKKVLRQAEHQGDLSPAKIAKTLGMHTNTVSRIILRFQETKLLNKTILLNFYKLGFSCCHMRFNLQVFSPSEEESLFKYLNSHPRVMWACNTGGQYQYELTFLSSSIEDFRIFQVNLSDSLAHGLGQKEFVLETEMNHFGIKHFNTEVKNAPLVHIEGNPAKPINIDEIDHKILWNLSNEGCPPVSKIAKNLGLPLSTVKYRKKKLLESGIVIAEHYTIDLVSCGLRVHRIQVRICKLGASSSKEFLQWCAKYPYIQIANICIGSWDFHLDIISYDEHHLIGTIRDLQTAFSNKIEILCSFPRFKQIKGLSYPFKLDSFSDYY